MEHLKDSLLIPIKNSKNPLLWYDTISQSALHEKYLQETGKVRAFFGGDCLKRAYQRFFNSCHSRSIVWLKQLQNISKTTCDK
jgi:hypothetical protein